MAAVRCPKCGTVNTEGARPYPRCGNCGEHLLKCRHCRHFDKRLLDCAHPLLAEGSHISDPDLYAACPHHDTTLRIGPSRHFLAVLASPPVLTALVLAVVIAAGAYTFAHYYKRANLVAAPRLTFKAAVHPDRASLGRIVWIKADITNRGLVRAEHVTLCVSRAFVTRFDAVDLIPAPEASHLDDQWERLDFGSLERGGVLTVRYTFMSKASGGYPLELRLLSGDGMSHGAKYLDVLVME